jgi:hypothetical protein
MERRIFGQNSFIGVYIHCIIIIHLFMWHSLDIHHFELNSYFHVPILNIKVHHHDATRCTMVELRTYRGHRGILHGDWGQVHHSLLNCIYEGHKGCPHLLHCELRNAMALYFVTAISHYPPPPPQCFFDVKWTDDYSQKFGISMISSSEDWIFGHTYLSLEPEPVASEGWWRLWASLLERNERQKHWNWIS